MKCLLQCISHITDVPVDVLVVNFDLDPFKIIKQDKIPFCYRGYNVLQVQRCLVKLGIILTIYPRIIAEQYYEDTVVDLIKLGELLSYKHKVIYCNDTHAVVGKPIEFDSLNNATKFDFDKLNYLCVVTK